MVRLVSALGYVLCGLSVAYANPPLPSARQVLPTPEQFLRAYKPVWQVGGPNRRYSSEADWRKENPDCLEQSRQLTLGLRQIPDGEWAAMKAQLKEQLKMVHGIGFSLERSGHVLLPPAFQVFVDASLRANAKTDIVRALEEYSGQLADGAVMEYVKVDRPDLVAKGKEPGGVAKFKIYLEIWKENSMRLHANQIDLDERGLQTLAATTRKNLRSTIELAARERANRAEEELQKLYQNYPDRRQEIAKQEAMLIALANIKMSVTAWRPAIGEAAHAIICQGPGPLDERPVGARQGTAQVRRGRALFKVSFEAFGSYATDQFAKEVEEVLKLLANRAESFALVPVNR